MYIDNHVHTRLSIDSDESIENYLSLLKGRGICITEHCEEGKVLSDLSHYPDIYNSYRNENVRLGLEYGALAGEYSLFNKIQDMKLDSITLSFHNIGDIWAGELYCLSDIKDYINYISRNIDTYKDCDVLNHFNCFGFYDLLKDYSLIEKELKNMFGKLIKNYMALEINSKYFRDFINIDLACRYYKEVGGVDVVLGSDSHSAQTLFKGFDKIKEIISSYGLREVYYCKRKKIYYT